MNDLEIIVRSDPTTHEIKVNGTTLPYVQNVEASGVGEGLVILKCTHVPLRVEGQVFPFYHGSVKDDNRQDVALRGLAPVNVQLWTQYGPGEMPYCELDGKQIKLVGYSVKAGMDDFAYVEIGYWKDTAMWTEPVTLWILRGRVVDRLKEAVEVETGSGEGGEVGS
jgi:hypothetical protein